MDTKLLERIIVEKTDETSGVYVIFNPIMMKVYVGETKDFYRRWAEHIGGIFRLESSSNINLESEFNKSFEIFPAVLAAYNKHKNESNKVKDWIIHETIIMYIFRCHGIELYNSNLGRDNTGRQREFLFDKEIFGENLKQKMIDYLNLNDNNHIVLEEFDCHDWEELFKRAEDEINKSIKDRFGMGLLQLAELKDDSKLILLWKKRLKHVERKKYYDISTENVRMICRELYSISLLKPLTCYDLKQCGLSELRVEELTTMVDKGCFNKIVVTKFGDYYDQSVKTILSTKIYDMSHNKINNLSSIIPHIQNPNSPICFWALKRLDINNTKNFLSEDDKSKEPRYAIMLHTPSKKVASSVKKNVALKEEYMKALNPNEDETIDHFFERSRQFLDDLSISPIAKDKFALGYALTEKDIRNKSGKKAKYPMTMFPEVIDKNGINKALLISELFFVNACYNDAEDIYDYFCSYLKHGCNELSTTLGSKKKAKRSSISHCCAKLVAKEGLINYLKSQSNYHMGGNPSFIVAKLEYPYIIALSNDFV